MTDKVQKIREEVEKIARSINPFLPDEDGKSSDYEAGRFAMVTQIMQIIDTMQEEPVITNEIIRKIIKAERRATWDDARLLSPKLTTEEALIAEIYKRINNG